MTDVDTVLYAGRPDMDKAEFDEATHTWTVAGRHARVVISIDGALPAERAYRADELAPYLGVAVHGVPNFFLLTGPDTAAQKGYIAKCLDYMSRTDSTRIEVRSGTQSYFNARFNARSSSRKHRRGHYWRRVGRRIPSAFEVSSQADNGRDPDDGVYDGPATVRFDDCSYDTQARLTGRMDPIDGHYHWQGTIVDTGFEVKLPRDVTVVVGERQAAARLTERTPWERYSVAGVGAPPFALAEIEVEVPLL